MPDLNRIFGGRRTAGSPFGSPAVPTFARRTASCSPAHLRATLRVSLFPRIAELDDIRRAWDCRQSIRFSGSTPFRVTGSTCFPGGPARDPETSHRSFDALRCQPSPIPNRSIGKAIFSQRRKARQAELIHDPQHYRGASLAGSPEKHWVGCFPKNDQPIFLRRFP